MKKKVLTLIAFCTFLFSSVSQELISENELLLKSNLRERRESLPIVNPLTNELSLFIIDRKTFYLNQYIKGKKYYRKSKYRQE